MSALSDPASSNNTRQQFSVTGTVYVNSLYPYGVGPIGVTQTPRDLGYSTFAAYKAASPPPYASSLDSFAGFVPTIDDECDLISSQGATNYLWDIAPGIMSSNTSTGRIVGNGAYVVNKGIQFNQCAVILEGALPNNRYYGTTIKYIGSGGTIDAPVSLLHFYMQTNLYQLPPGRTGGNPGAQKVIVRNLGILGTGGALSQVSQSAGHKYVQGIRFEGGSAFTQVENCAFDSSLYDGVVTTSSSLFQIFGPANWFGSIARDAIVNTHNESVPSSNNTTTTWIYNNEFIGCGRYGIMLDYSGGAVEGMPIIRDNSFEFAPGVFYPGHPEWYVGGICTWNCFINCSNMNFDSNRFEAGGDGSAYWGELFMSGCTGATVQNSTVHQAIVGTIPSRTSAAVTFEGVSQTITAISKANPGVVTATAHGFSNGNQVLFYGMAGTMSQLQLALGTVTVIDADNFSIGINTTTYSTYSGSLGRAFVGNNWCDVTDQRNYNIGSTGSFGSTMAAAFRHNYNFSAIYSPDGGGFDGTDVSSFIDQNFELISIPTTAGTYARLMQPRATAVPTILTPNSPMSFRNSYVKDLNGGRVYSDYEAQTKLGSYRVISGASIYLAWAASTAYEVATFNGDTPWRRPTVDNGFFYQCTTAGTSNSLEPTWGTVIGGTTPDNNGTGSGAVVWTCVGRIAYAAEANAAEWVEATYRRRMGAAAPTTGYWTIGSKVYATDPYSVGFEGWVASTNGVGSAATWKTFGPVTP